MQNNGCGENKIIDHDGQVYIAASQRPDGSWRKARRVKTGYVPQEEVPKYESKGKQWVKDVSEYPVGLSPETIAAAKAKKSKGKGKQSSAEGFSSGNVKLSQEFGDMRLSSKISSSPVTKSVNSSLSDSATVEDEKTVQNAKKLKNLRRKLHDIDELIAKINSGQLQKPEKNQLEKIAKRDAIASEILVLEADE